MSILISIPAGITANQTATQNLTVNLSETIARTEASINQALTQIECSLTPSFEGFGFSPPPSGNFQRPENIADNFMPGQFGGGRVPGQFGGGPFGGRGNVAMNETLYTDIKSISGVAAVVPILEVSQGENQTIEMFGRSFTRMVPNYIIEGIPLTSLVDSYPILPTNITAGRNLQPGDSGVVLLSENNTRFFNAGVGDKIEILGQTFEVVGVYGSTGVSDVMTLYMNLTDAQTVTNNVGYITSLLVFTNDSSSVSDVAAALNSLHPELNVVTAQQRLDQLNDMRERYTAELQNAQTTLSQTQATALQEIVVVVAATSLIVLFVMLYTVRERTKEIGTLKAIGFSNRNILSQFVLEGIMLSAVAGVVGIAIGTIAAPFISSILIPTVNPIGNVVLRVGTGITPAVNVVTVDPQLMLMTFGASILLGMLGSLYPAWRASKIRPAEAMRYE
ncbi:MAG: FtsX-like permease family protein [Candidatus Bathyarchaeota archaeon]|nr:FtsX-like permease family protein [Candidatus Bathyarchaeota archaeon]